MSKIIVLNHKMNLVYDEIEEYLKILNKIDTSNKVIVCPSNLYLESFVKNSKFKIGSQNVSSKKEGAFTGEVSALQLKRIGVDYVIVGHSEVRRNLKETNDLINKKIKVSLENALIPILCIGEEKSDYDNGNTLNVLKKELDECLKDVNLENIIIAYEPIWSIGTNDVLELDTLNCLIKEINDYLFSKFNCYATIIYGGSVNVKNIKDVLELPNIAGVLVGSSSIVKENLMNLL